MTRRSAGLAGLLLLVGLLTSPTGAVAASPPAPADPGTCVQRYDGPHLVPTVGAWFGYVAYSRCAGNYYFRVHLLSTGRSTPCAEVHAHSFQSFFSVSSEDWILEACSSGTKTPAGPSAGSNSCGHRIVQPTPVGGGVYAYTIRNLCSAHSFRVYLPRFERYTGACQGVHKLRVAFYPSAGIDPDWRVVTC